MWPLVREGLLVYRRFLLNAWAVCTIGVAAVFLVLALTGVVDRHKALVWAAAAWPAYMLLAGAVAGWIAIGTEHQEKRLRLHFLLPLPLLSIALAQVMLPTVLLVSGLVVARTLAAIVALAHVGAPTWLRPAHLDLLAAHMLFIQQVAFAAKELMVLRERSWSGSALGILFLVAISIVDCVVGLPGARPDIDAAIVLGLAVVTDGFGLTLFRGRRELAR